MTIKELVHRLTHVTLVNANDLTSEEVILDENVELDEIALLCKNKDGSKRASFVKFDDVFGSTLVDRKNNVIKMLFNLTNVDTIQDVHKQELPPLTGTAWLIQQEREKNEETKKSNS